LEIDIATPNLLDSMDLPFAELVTFARQPVCKDLDELGGVGSLSSMFRLLGGDLTLR